MKLISTPHALVNVISLFEKNKQNSLQLTRLPSLSHTLSWFVTNISHLFFKFHDGRVRSFFFRYKSSIRIIGHESQTVYYILILLYTLFGDAYGVILTNVTVPLALMWVTNLPIMQLSFPETCRAS